MKLGSNSFNRAIHAGKRYNVMKTLFSNFFNSGQYLAQPASGLSGLSFEEHLENNYFDVSYLDIRLRFEFTILLKEDNSVSGNVYCSKESPKFSDSKNILGVINFNSEGVTDFEADQNMGAIQIHYNALEIITHFITLALEKPL